MNQLPIDAIKQKIQDLVLISDVIIIKSTPGSGKTTRVPLFLSEIFFKKIYVLEPRRIAAKYASEYLTASGHKNVGHIFKYENQTNENSRIIFLTEGTFLRILSNNLKLEDCDVVILDEFHERHYHTDLALSFLLKVKANNPKLKIVIMSATLDLNDFKKINELVVNQIEVTTRQYDLSIEYLPNNTIILGNTLERKVLNAIDSVIEIPGHILVFLPGMNEIRKCSEIIEKSYSFELVILHGEVAGVKIDDSYNDLEKKKIILSTNIAESSITIPGVRVVIDSGLHRISKLDPIARVQSLELKKISQSSAIQRANRASRQDAGKAIRLYAEMDFLSRQLFDEPEIKRTDLSELILMSKAFFDTEIEDLYFLNELEAKEIIAAKTYLEHAKLFDDKDKIVKYPFHPRISKVLLKAGQYSDKTFESVVDYLSSWIEPKQKSRFKKNVHQYFRSSGNKGDQEVEYCLLFGYFDHIAKLSNERFDHRNGTSFKIAHELKGEIDLSWKWWVVLSLNNRNEVTRAIQIEEDWFFDLDTFPITEERQFSFDASKNAIKVESLTRIGNLAISKEKIPTNIEDEEVLNFFVKNITPLFIEKQNQNSFQRLYLLEKLSSKKIKDFLIEKWIRKKAFYIFNAEDLNLFFQEMENDIFNFLNDDNRFVLDIDLPLEVELLDKKKIKIIYDSTNGAMVESYIQDFYGITKFPLLLKGAERLRISLLGPHKRPLQVTDNLAGFWQKAYKELYKELKREYPRHYWPINPESARPILLARNVI